MDEAALMRTPIAAPVKGAGARALSGAILFFVLLSIIFTNVLQPIFPFIRHFDEGLAAFCVLATFVFVIQSKKIAAIELGIALFLGGNLLLYLPRSKLPVIDIVIQLFIHIKLFIYLSFLLRLVAKSIFWHRLLTKVLLLALVIQIIGTIANGILGPSFYTLLGRTFLLEGDIRRGGLFRLGGAQVLPIMAGFFFAMVYFFILYHLEFRFAGAKVRVLSFIATLLFAGFSFLTGTRTAIFLILLLYVHFLIKKRDIGGLALGVLAVGAFFVASADVINVMYSRAATSAQDMLSGGGAEEIRSLMLVNGALLLKENFPLGSGPGTFGTVYSLESDTYNKLGMSDSFFVKNEYGLYDSNMASLMGELGATGLLGIIFLFIALGKTYYKVAGPNRANAQIFAGFVACVMICSFFQPIFMNGLQAALAAVTLAALAGRARFVR